MMRRLLALLATLIAAPLLAQTVPAPTPVDTPLPRVEMITSAGRIVVEVEVKKAPITAANFLKYVDTGRLNGITVYRTCRVAERFGFIQFGVDGNATKILPPIKHEPTSLTGLKHLEGTLSIARLAPGTARGEFTIMVGDQPGMDADPTRPVDALHTELGYAAFGRVVEGMDVVLKIFGAPINPTATNRGAFKGEIPVAPVKILTVRRLKA